MRGRKQECRYGKERKGGGHTRRLAAAGRTFLVMASGGGSGFTDLQQPTNTVSTAVKTMFALIGTGISSGATASSAKAACAAGAASSGALWRAGGAAPAVPAGSVETERGRPG